MKNKILIAFLLICTYTIAQVGIGTNNPKATLDVTAKIAKGNSTEVDGMIVPRVDRERAQLMTGVDESTLIYINDATTGTQLGQAKNIDINGFYYFLENEWIKLSLNKESKVFFYMPSILLPTNKISTNYVTYDASNDNYVVDLHAIFKDQFEYPIKSSRGALSLSSSVLNRNAYDYYIIYADNLIFPHTDIIFSSVVGEEGKFTYKVDSDLVIRNGAFMNIVLKVK